MAEDRNGFWLLAGGALLFAVGFVLGLEWLKLDEKLTWLEPPVLVALCSILFGIPYVLRELWRQTNWALVAYFLILIPLFHFLATYTLLYVSNAMSEAAGQMAAQAAAAAEMGEAVQAPPDPAAMRARPARRPASSTAATMSATIPGRCAPDPGRSSAETR